MNYKELLEDQEWDLAMGFAEGVLMDSIEKKKFGIIRETKKINDQYKLTVVILLLPKYLKRKVTFEEEEEIPTKRSKNEDATSTKRRPSEDLQHHLKNLKMDL